MAKKKNENETEISEATENAEVTESVSDSDGEESDIAAELVRMTEYAKRVTADMENMKKRNKSIASDMYNEGVRDTLIKLLPVLDSMERAFQINTDENVKKGLDNIIKMFVDVLNKIGVTEIECMDKEPDPNYHNVMMQTDDEEHAGKIVNVFEKGYLIGDRVLRHAGVVVAK